MVSAESAAEVVVPCLWLSEGAEAAATFYAQLLPAGRVLATTHYPEATDNPANKPRGSVLTVEFEVAGQRLTTLNGGPEFRINPSISFILHVESPEQAAKTTEALTRGGRVLPNGWVQDRFGVAWQVETGQREPGGAVIVPCFTFSGPVRGRAAEAIETYSKIFPAGRVVAVKKDGGKARGRFMAAGHELVARDGDLEATFDEGLSMQVMCKSQEELDEYWARLGEGGSHGPCGWLRDRFGVAWQVVPHELSRWLRDDDRLARDRVFAAMLEMKKIDVEALGRAFEGR